ncbi:hypothetical protein HDV05_006859 [Chytridiales sp. JEL 0842]|nr:hypothetical protein HDV05_006859 [Chytridiales sp. JEL 0842]
MAELKSYVDSQVAVVTYDGRLIFGVLKGFDQMTNLILSKAVERIISPKEETEEVPLGLYIIRGPNVATVGEVDEEKDDMIDWAQVRAPTMEKPHSRAFVSSAGDGQGQNDRIKVAEQATTTDGEGTLSNEEEEKKIAEDTQNRDTTASALPEPSSNSPSFFTNLFQPPAKSAKESSDQLLSVTAQPATDDRLWDHQQPTEERIAPLSEAGSHQIASDLDPIQAQYNALFAAIDSDVPKLSKSLDMPQTRIETVDHIEEQYRSLFASIDSVPSESPSSAQDSIEHQQRNLSEDRDPIQEQYESLFAAIEKDIPKSSSTTESSSSFDEDPIEFQYGSLFASIDSDIPKPTPSSVSASAELDPIESQYGSLFEAISEISSEKKSSMGVHSLDNAEPWIDAMKAYSAPQVTDRSGSWDPLESRIGPDTQFASSPPSTSTPVHDFESTDPTSTLQNPTTTGESVPTSNSAEENVLAFTTKLNRQFLLSNLQSYTKDLEELYLKYPEAETRKEKIVGILVLLEDVLTRMEKLFELGDATPEVEFLFETAQNDLSEHLSEFLRRAESDDETSKADECLNTLHHLLSASKNIDRNFLLSKVQKAKEELEASYRHLQAKVIPADAKPRTMKYLAMMSLLDELSEMMLALSEQYDSLAGDMQREVDLLFGTLRDRRKVFGRLPQGRDTASDKQKEGELVAALNQVLEIAKEMSQRCNISSRNSEAPDTTLLVPVNGLTSDVSSEKLEPSSTSISSVASTSDIPLQTEHMTYSNPPSPSVDSDTQYRQNNTAETLAYPSRTTSSSEINGLRSLVQATADSTLTTTSTDNTSLSSSFPPTQSQTTVESFKDELKELKLNNVASDQTEASTTTMVKTDAQPQDTLPKPSSHLDRDNSSQLMPPESNPQRTPLDVSSDDVSGEAPKSNLDSTASSLPPAESSHKSDFFSHIARQHLLSKFQMAKKRLQDLYARKHVFRRRKGKKVKHMLSSGEVGVLRSEMENVSIYLNELSEELEKVSDAVQRSSDIEMQFKVESLFETVKVKLEDEVNKFLRYADVPDTESNMAECVKALRELLSNTESISQQYIVTSNDPQPTPFDPHNQQALLHAKVQRHIWDSEARMDAMQKRLDATHRQIVLEREYWTSMISEPDKYDKMIESLQKRIANLEKAPIPDENTTLRTRVKTATKLIGQLSNKIDQEKMRNEILWKFHPATASATGGETFFERVGEKLSTTNAFAHFKKLHEQQHLGGGGRESTTIDLAEVQKRIDAVHQEMSAAAKRLGDRVQAAEDELKKTDSQAIQQQFDTLTNKKVDALPLVPKESQAVEEPAWVEETLRQQHGGESGDLESGTAGVDTNQEMQKRLALVSRQVFLLQNSLGVRLQTAENELKEVLMNMADVKSSQQKVDLMAIKLNNVGKSLYSLIIKVNELRKSVGHGLDEAEWLEMAIEHQNTTTHDADESSKKNGLLSWLSSKVAKVIRGEDSSNVSPETTPSSSTAITSTPIYELPSTTTQVLPTNSKLVPSSTPAKQQPAEDPATPFLYEIFTRLLKDGIYPLPKNPNVITEAYVYALHEEKAANRFLSVIMEVSKREGDLIKVVGLDVETAKRVGSDAPSTVQIAFGERLVGIFEVYRMCSSTDANGKVKIVPENFPKSLRMVLENQTFAKVGVGIQHDSLKLNAAYNVKMKHVIDISAMATLVNCSFRSLTGLYYAYVDKSKLLKKSSSSGHNWDDFNRKPAAVAYAANDAIASLQVFQRMVTRPNLPVKIISPAKEKVTADMQFPAPSAKMLGKPASPNVKSPASKASASVAPSTGTDATAAAVTSNNATNVKIEEEPVDVHVDPIPGFPHSTNPEDISYWIHKTTPTRHRLIEMLEITYPSTSDPSVKLDYSTPLDKKILSVLIKDIHRSPRLSKFLKRDASVPIAQLFNILCRLWPTFQPQYTFLSHTHRRWFLAHVVAVWIGKGWLGPLRWVKNGDLKANLHARMRLGAGPKMKFQQAEMEVGVGVEEVGLYAAGMKQGAYVIGRRVRGEEEGKEVPQVVGETAAVAVGVGAAAAGAEVLSNVVVKAKVADSSVSVSAGPPPNPTSFVVEPQSPVVEDSQDVESLSERERLEVAEEVQDPAVESTPESESVDVEEEIQAQEAESSSGPERLDPLAEATDDDESDDGSLTIVDSESEGKLEADEVGDMILDDEEGEIKVLELDKEEEEDGIELLDLDKKEPEIEEVDLEEIMLEDLEVESPREAEPTSSTGDSYISDNNTWNESLNTISDIPPDTLPISQLISTILPPTPSASPPDSSPSTSFSSLFNASHQRIPTDPSGDAIPAIRETTSESLVGLSEQDSVKPTPLKREQQSGDVVEGIEFAEQGGPHLKGKGGLE